MQSIARNAVGQSFHMTTAGAYPSQAENTLTQYKGTSKSDTSGSTRDTSSRKMECFGCGGEHPWQLRGATEPYCPNRDQPGARAKAELNFAAFRQRRKKQSDARKKKRGREKEVNFSDFSEAQQKLICQQVLAVRTMTSEDDMSVASSVTTPSELTSTANAGKPRKQSRSALFRRNDGSGNSTGQMILVIDVSVLASGTSMLPGLPVPINTLFPHIALELGLDVGGASNPLLMSVIDTAAALTTGNFYYVAKIAKAFPHCLAKIFLPKDYSPVILSGIVQKDGESVTTALQVEFLFHLPYLSREGEPTSLMIATGTHVTVNLILGLPFITSTGMIIDTTDQVAELRALDSPPFPIEYRRATVHVPLIDESAVPVNYSNYRDIIAEVDQLEEYMMAQSATMASEALRPRQVTFGAATTTSHGGRQTVSVDMAIDEPVAIPACPIIGGRRMNDSINDHDPTLGIHSADIA